MIRAILLDIEGTTTPISFVHEVLFPYARKHLKGYIAQHSGAEDLLADLDQLRKERQADLTEGQQPPELIEPYVYWLIDRDRKSPGLKSVQGKIWKEGYSDGSLRSQVFEDVPSAIKRWREAGLSVNIFSSGSVLAQQLLFSHTEAGDLTNLIDQYFDTGVGKKIEAESYRRIATRLSVAPNEILFVSDVVSELDAAHEAGMRTALSVRPGNPESSHPHQHTVIENLNEITIDM